MTQGHYRRRSVGIKPIELQKSDAPTGILTDRALARRTDPEEHRQYAENADVRIDAESIAKVRYCVTDPLKRSSELNFVNSPISTWPTKTVLRGLGSLTVSFACHL